MQSSREVGLSLDHKIGNIKPSDWGVHSALIISDPDTPSGESLLSWDHVSLALATANSCFNPFLYALLGKDFRRKARQSMQGILEAAFSEDVTHSTSCPQNKTSFERNSISTVV